jgi:hypothetical protein
MLPANGLLKTVCVEHDTQVGGGITTVPAGQKASYCQAAATFSRCIDLPVLSASVPLNVVFLIWLLRPYMLTLSSS